MQSYDLVVIGSGPAGQRGAVQAAKLGKRVAVIEKRRDMGGVCINTGTIPSKTLREAVLDLSGYRQRELYGADHRVRQEITVQDLFYRTNAVMTREREVIRSQLQRNGVRLIAGTGAFAGPHEITVDDGESTQSIQADYVLIAVGTRPGLPTGLAVDHERVLTSDDILALPRLPRTMTVVGAGVIGVEYATLFAVLGVEVTLMDKRGSMLEMVDRELVDALTHQARQMNVTLRLGEEVSKLEMGAAGGVIVGMKSGKRHATEMVLVSAGRQGMTEGLNLDRAGLTSDDRGRITVNDSYQTATSHIYAAGDVIGFPALASTSAEQGRLSACHMFGVEARSVPALFPFGIYAVPEIAWVGKNEEELTGEGVPFETGVARYEEIARGHILGDDAGMLKLIFHLDTQQILGVWVIGTQATELVHIGQAVMSLGGTLEYFVSTVFNYPTLAECYKVAALDGYNKLRDLSRVGRAMPPPAVPPGAIS
ncbi:MAG: Si-specific NAD(P)(+) transhydrogenase [Candidatus Eisenbacteria bacterium]